MAKMVAAGVGAVDMSEHTLRRLAPAAGSGPLVDAMQRGRAELFHGHPLGRRHGPVLQRLLVAGFG